MTMGAESAFAANEMHPMPDLKVDSTPAPVRSRRRALRGALLAVVLGGVIYGTGGLTWVLHRWVAHSPVGHGGGRVTAQTFA
jgi:hypothetical protein